MSSILFKMKLNITYQKPCNPYSFSNVIRLIKKKKSQKIQFLLLEFSYTSTSIIKAL